MKIRNNFVSNSSTSSFILVGCCTENLGLTDEDIDKISEGECEDIQFYSEDDLIGINIASWSDDCGIEELDLGVILEQAKKVELVLKKFLEKKSISVPAIKIYGGIRAS